MLLRGTCRHCREPSGWDWRCGAYVVCAPLQSLQTSLHRPRTFGSGESEEKCRTAASGIRKATCGEGFDSLVERLLQRQGSETRSHSKTAESEAGSPADTWRSRECPYSNRRFPSPCKLRRRSSGSIRLQPSFETAPSSVFRFALPD